MTLSVIIPCFNECSTILPLLARVRNVDLPKEIIVVDDGSSDGTREILSSLNGDASDLRVLFHDRNRGKGAAVRTGLEQATGEIVIIQDADLEYDPNDYHAIIAPIVEGRAQVVYGSRNVRRNRSSYLIFYWGGRLLTLVANMLYGARLTDEATCYKAFRRPILEGLQLESNGFELCSELTAKVLRSGHAIREVPISYHPRSREQGKKITARDGALGIWTLLKYRFRAPGTGTGGRNRHA